MYRRRTHFRRPRDQLAYKPGREREASILKRGRAWPDLLLAKVGVLGIVLRLLVLGLVPVRETLRFSVFIAWLRKVDIRLNSNSPGARPVH